MKVEILTHLEDAGVITLRFTSTASSGADEEWLARSRAFLGGRPDGNYFELDPPARYQGRVVKRRPYTHDELVELGPGQSVTSQPVHLQELYRLDDLSSVRVRYRGKHPLHGPEQGGGPFDPVDAEWTTVPLRS